MSSTTIDGASASSEIASPSESFAEAFVSPSVLFMESFASMFSGVARKLCYHRIRHVLRRAGCYRVRRDFRREPAVFVRAPDIRRAARNVGIFEQRGLVEERRERNCRIYFRRRRGFRRVVFRLCAERAERRFVFADYAFGDFNPRRLSVERAFRVCRNRQSAREEFSALFIRESRDRHAPRRTRRSFFCGIEISASIDAFAASISGANGFTSENGNAGAEIFARVADVAVTSQLFVSYEIFESAEISAAFLPFASEIPIASDSSVAVPSAYASAVSPSILSPSDSIDEIERMCATIAFRLPPILIFAFAAPFAYSASAEIPSLSVFESAASSDIFAVEVLPMNASAFAKMLRFSATVSPPRLMYARVSESGAAVSRPLLRLRTSCELPANVVGRQLDSICECVNKTRGDCECRLDFRLRKLFLRLRLEGFC